MLPGSVLWTSQQKSLIPFMGQFQPARTVLFWWSTSPVGQKAIGYDHKPATNPGRFKMCGLQVVLNAT